jgi:hypothetical protein
VHVDASRSPGYRARVADAAALADEKPTGIEWIT